jgi:hypothetical protein
LPPALQRIVAHCLEKNPQERFAAARDLAFDLESLSDVSATATSARATAVSPGRARCLWAAVAGLATLVAAATAGFWAGGRASHRPPPTYQQLTFGRGAVGTARFSPDGATVLYSATWNGAPARLFAMRLDLPTEQPLGLEGRLAGCGKTAHEGHSSLA